MFKKINWPRTLLFAALGAILFCIPVFIYIQDALYTRTWLLYMGSFLFFIVMWIHAMYDSSKRGNNESTVALIFASHVTAIIGIIISVVLCFILLSIFVPGYLHAGTPDKVLANPPANTIQDKTNGLSFDIFFAATIINFSVGSFTGIVLPFYMKRNQTKDQREPTPLHQSGARS
jgi:hypothetical protein